MGRFDKPRIGLDVDGVIADFVAGICALLRVSPFCVTTWNIHDCIAVSETDIWEKVRNEGDNFWAQLPKYPWADELVAKLSAMGDLCFVTANAKSPGCLEGKRHWLAVNYPNVPVVYAEQKWRMATPLTVLVDDHEKNCDEFMEAGGRAVLFPMPWNAYRGIPHERRVDSTIEEVQEAIDWMSVVVPSPPPLD